MKMLSQPIETTNEKEIKVKRKKRETNNNIIKRNKIPMLYLQ